MKNEEFFLVLPSVLFQKYDYDPQMYSMNLEAVGYHFKIPEEGPEPRLLDGET